MPDTPNPVLTPSPEIPPMVFTKGISAPKNDPTKVLQMMVDDPGFKKLVPDEQLRVFKEVATAQDPQFAALPELERNRIAQGVLNPKPPSEPWWMTTAKGITDVGSFTAGSGLGTVGGAALGTPLGPPGMAIGGALGSVGGAALGGAISNRMKRLEDYLYSGKITPETYGQTLKNMGKDAGSNAIWEMLGTIPLNLLGKWYFRIKDINSAFGKASEDLLQKTLKLQPKGLEYQAEKESLRELGAEIPHNEPDDLARMMSEARKGYPKLAEKSREALNLERTKILESATPDTQEGAKAVQELADAFNNLLARPDTEAGRKLLTELNKFNAIPKGLVNVGPKRIFSDEAVAIYDAIEEMRVAGKFKTAQENEVANLIQEKAENLLKKFVNQENEETLKSIHDRIAHHLRLIRPHIEDINTAKDAEKMAEIYFNDPQSGLMLANAATDGEKSLLRQLFGERMYKAAGEKEGIPNFNKLVEFLRRNQAVAKALGFNDLTQLITLEGRMQYITDLINHNPKVAEEFRQGMIDGFGQGEHAIHGLGYGGAPTTPFEAAVEHFRKQRQQSSGTTRYIWHRIVLHSLVLGAQAKFLQQIHWVPSVAIWAFDTLRYVLMEDPTWGPIMLRALQPGSSWRTIGSTVAQIMAGTGSYATKELYLDAPPTPKRRSQEPTIRMPEPAGSP